VQILTADHPRDAAERAEGMEFGKPVTIGRKVRIGGGASFCRASPSATMR
jgi:maltose O-acetyltransferase